MWLLELLLGLLGLFVVFALGWKAGKTYGSFENLLLNTKLWFKDHFK